MKRFAFLLGLFFTVPTFGQELIAQLPFKIKAGHIHVQVRIDESKSLTMAFDTGARANLLDENVAKTLNFEITGRQQVEGASGTIIIESSESHSLEFGAHVFEEESFFLIDLERLSDEDHPIDGVIGGSILDRFVTEINFDTSEIRLYSHDSYETFEGFEAQRFSLYPFGIPVLSGSLDLGNGKKLEGPYLVDTGAALALSLNAPLVKKKKLIKSLTPNYPYVSRNVNSESTDIIGRLPQYKFLGYEFQGFPVRMTENAGGVSGRSDVDGIIGLELLKRFNLIFDYSKQTLYFQPNNLYDLPFVENFSGLVVRKEKGKLKVEQVIDDSPAQAKGLQECDLIISVDGQKDMTKFDFYDYVHPLRKSVSLEILRGEEVISVVIEPKRII